MWNSLKVAIGAYLWNGKKDNILKKSTFSKVLNSLMRKPSGEAFIGILPPTEFSQVKAFQLLVEAPITALGSLSEILLNWLSIVYHLFIIQFCTFPIELSFTFNSYSLRYHLDNLRLSKTSFCIKIARDFFYWFCLICKWTIVLVRWFDGSIWSIVGV